MIVEVRTYQTKPGFRDKFIEFFEKRSVPAQQAHGMGIVGPLLDLENPDVFVWLRTFPSPEERERMRNAFYDSDEWKNDLEPTAMPMLQSYSIAVTETSPAFVANALT